MTLRHLVGLGVVVGAITGLYTVLEVEPSALAEICLTIALPLGIAGWIEADARARRRTPCYEFATFCFFGWLLAGPWYALWSRGAGGRQLAMRLVGVVLLPWLVGAVVIILATVLQLATG